MGRGLGSPVPDVFVSYAREDREQVRRVDDALQARGFDTWVDWDILPSTDWMSEVESAITRSDAFLFALSPVRVEAAQVSQNGERVVVVIGSSVWSYGCPACRTTPDLVTRARSHVSSYVRRHAWSLLDAQ